MSDQGYILAPQTITITFSIEPAINAVNTLLLLSGMDNLSGTSDWVNETKAGLSPERRRIHEMVIDGLFKAIHPTRSYTSFPAYVDELAATDPVELRDRAMKWLSDPAYLAEKGLTPRTQAELLADADVYISHIREIYEGKSSEEPADDEFDTAMYRELHALLNDPLALRARIVDHLSTMWRDVLARQWQHNVPMLEESVQAFRQIDYQRMTPVEAIRAITGRDVSGVWDKDLAKLHHITFVPSAHIGPYVRLFMEEDRGWLVFGARLPEGARIESAALSRSDLLVRLSALADDTRLQILELLTQHEEMCAQEIMNQLELSQSSTSRHLRQLTATGYLIERRREVSKCYSLNTARVEDTMRALRRFLKKGTRRQ